MKQQRNIEHVQINNSKYKYKSFEHIVICIWGKDVHHDGEINPDKRFNKKMIWIFWIDEVQLENHGSEWGCRQFSFQF